MKSFLSHFFLPHPSNKHKAKILHHSSLFFLTAVFFALALVFSSLPVQKPGGVLGISSNISAQELLTLTNLKRADNHLPPLTMNAELTNAATAKAADMFAKNYWAHVAPDGTTPWVFIKNAGYQYLYAGENLARGFTTSGDVVNAWMASPSHRENMLSPNYTDIGFAIQEGNLTGDDTILVVEEMGSRVSTQQTPQTTSVAVQAPTPTLTVVQAIRPAVSPVQIAVSTPTPTPSPAPVIVRLSPAPSPTSQIAVAALHNDPLIDTRVVRENIALFIVGLFIIVLGIDIVVVQRQKLVRLFSHNLDHLIFFTILLILLILIGGGAIL